MLAQGFGRDGIAATGYSVIRAPEEGRGGETEQAVQGPDDAVRLEVTTQIQGQESVQQDQKDGEEIGLLQPKQPLPDSHLLSAYHTHQQFLLSWNGLEPSV